MQTTVTKSSLVTRRREFRRQRWLLRLTGLWRLSLAAGLAGGLIWLKQEPFWQLHSGSAIDVRGNVALSRAQIRDALSITYPSAVTEVEPQTLREHLLTSLPVQSASIQRQLWPPALLVEVQELEPVAFAPRPGEWGIVDHSGVWVSLRKYPALNRPKLSVWGYTDDKANLWREIYPQIAQSPLRVQVIDLRDPGNLVLRTEFGEVHMGAFSTRFANQLRRLDQMREITKRYKPADIAFIDLRSSQVPTLRLRVSTF